MRLPTCLFFLAMFLTSPAIAQPRAPTYAECGAMMDARDQIAAGIRIDAMEAIHRPGWSVTGPRRYSLRVVADVIPSDLLASLEADAVRAFSTEVRLACENDPARGAPRYGRLQMSLPAFSSDGRWMVIHKLQIIPMESEGYTCAFEWTGGRWQQRKCALIFIS